MVLALLHRIDAEMNMARFYSVDVASNLFGETSVLRTWGRIGTRGRTRIETCSSPCEADVSAAKTLRAKVRRGYFAL